MLSTGLATTMTNDRWGLSHPADVCVIHGAVSDWMMHFQKRKSGF